ncbi:MAG: tRNA lysidine(34) synthetase TilS [Planctomycetaceae bacterium]
MRPSENLPAIVRSVCKQRNVCGRALLVAVSGGPDSVALLRALVELRSDCGFELRAAHVHHGWRGAEADADADWVRMLGERFDVPTVVIPITPEMKAAQTGRSLEEGARNARYDVLTQHASEQNCSLIAVGHTADDQVETVLHHILRGTGLAGLSGMPVERFLSRDVRLIRPLLSVSRADVLSFLTARDQDYRVDATNADVELTRNRLRHGLLPSLREQFNPRVDQALLGLSSQAAESIELLDRMADDVLQEVMLDESETCCRLDATRLSIHPEPFVRYILRRLWIHRNWPRQEMGQREWQRLARLVFESGALDLPKGISARRDAGPLVLTFRS